LWQITKAAAKITFQPRSCCSYSYNFISESQHIAADLHLYVYPRMIIYADFFWSYFFHLWRKFLLFWAFRFAFLFFSFRVTI
jgi:hypothetical protein